MNVTIYTIADCPFCSQEKEYLTQKGIVYEEKNVAENRAFLEEMLKVSNKFAGVPFTHIVKDDGTQVHLCGFTKEEFDAALVDGNAVPDVVENVPQEEVIASESADMSMTDSTAQTSVDIDATVQAPTHDSITSNDASINVNPSPLSEEINTSQEAKTVNTDVNVDDTQSQNVQSDTSVFAPTSSDTVENIEANPQTETVEENLSITEPAESALQNVDQSYVEAPLSPDPVISQTPPQIEAGDAPTNEMSGAVTPSVVADPLEQLSEESPAVDSSGVDTPLQSTDAVDRDGNDAENAQSQPVANPNPIVDRMI